MGTMVQDHCAFWPPWLQRLREPPRRVATVPQPLWYAAPGLSGSTDTRLKGIRFSVGRGDGMHGGQSTLRELSGAPATHIIYLPRWCHDPPDARVVAYFITLSSWSPPYARPRWCCGISHRNVSSLCLHSAALITAKTTAGATVGMLDVDAILPGGLRYTFDDGGCDHRPDPLALRPCRADLSWRSSSPAGEQSSSSWSTLATRMPGLVAIRVAVAAAVMNSRGSCHSGVALRVFFRARVCAASERCVVLCCSPRGLCVW